MMLLVQFIIVYLTTCFEDAMPCSFNMCLSWKINNTRFSITCQILSPDVRVHIMDPRNKTVGDCSPPGCDAYITNSKMSKSGNRYIFEVKNVQQEQIDGTWSCVNGRNRGYITTLVSSIVLVSRNESYKVSTTHPGTLITENKTHVSVVSIVTTDSKIHKTETNDIFRVGENTTSTIEGNTKTWIERISDILQNKHYMPIWISIVLFLVFFVSCNVFISIKCRSSHSLKLNNLPSVSTNTPTLRSVNDRDEDIISEYASIDENQMLSQADLQKQISGNRTHVDNLSYCSIIAPPSSSSSSVSRFTVVSSNSNGYLDVIADVYESPVSSRYFNCDEEHKYSTTVLNNIVHVYQNDAFVQ